MFGHPQQQQQQQGSGDLLLGGRGGFDISITSNGFGNDSGAPNSSGSTAVSSGQGGLSTFDLSDFPSLGGSPTAAVASGGENSSLANALRQQQQILAQQQMMQSNSGHNGSGIGIVPKGNAFSRLAMGTSMANALGSAGGPNFKMATEDFPALPGAPLSGGIGNSGSGLLSTEGGQVGGSSPANLSFTTGNPTLSITRSSSNVSSGVFGGELDGFTTNQFDSSASSLFGGVGSGGGGFVGNLASQSSSNPGISQQRPVTSMASSTSAPTGAPAPKASNPPGGAGSALSGDYGLLGLLKIIRLSDADRNALAVGSDLTSLGLNLNSSDNLYNTFLSPWSESPATREPHYQLPMCYYMQPPALKTGHLSKFQLETLFYIFYALPKDVLQAYAAQELYAREWKYHVDLKLWFKRANPSDGGQFVYFDINSWERRLFNGNMNQNITSGLLPEDDIRVKFTSS